MLTEVGDEAGDRATRRRAGLGARTRHVGVDAGRSGHRHDRPQRRAGERVTVSPGASKARQIDNRAAEGRSKQVRLAGCQNCGQADRLIQGHRAGERAQAERARHPISSRSRHGKADIEDGIEAISSSTAASRARTGSARPSRACGRQARRTQVMAGTTLLEVKGVRDLLRQHPRAERRRRRRQPGRDRRADRRQRRRQVDADDDHLRQLRAPGPAPSPSPAPTSPRCRRTRSRACASRSRRRGGASSRA